MSDHEYVDSNWCPDCGEPRGVCRCDESDWYAADEMPDDQLPEAPIHIDKMGYQYLPEIDCPHCKTATIYTDDGVDEEGDPRGAIYCVTCNRTFQQAFDVRVCGDEEIPL